MISIHALHEESDLVNYLGIDNSTTISIHALHEESDDYIHHNYTGRTISIHALHEESDRLSDVQPPTTADISIHALHEESDEPFIPQNTGIHNFNPRSP